MAKQQKWDKESYLSSVPNSLRNNIKTLLDWADENIKVIPQPKKGERWTGFQLAVDRPSVPLKICKIDVFGIIQLYPGYSSYLLNTNPFNSDKFHGEFCKKLNEANISNTPIEPSQLRKKGPKILLSNYNINKLILMINWIKERIISLDHSQSL